MSNKKISLELLHCPGDTIAEILEERKLTKQWLSQQLGVSGNKAFSLLHGRMKITTDLAIKLEEIFRVDYQFWINRQALYGEKLKMIKRL